MKQKTLLIFIVLFSSLVVSCSSPTKQTPDSNNNDDGISVNSLPSPDGDKQTPQVPEPSPVDPEPTQPNQEELSCSLEGVDINDEKAFNEYMECMNKLSVGDPTIYLVAPVEEAKSTTFKDLYKVLDQIENFPLKTKTNSTYFRIIDESKPHPKNEYLIEKINFSFFDDLEDDSWANSQKNTFKFYAKNYVPSDKVELKPLDEVKDAINPGLASLQKILNLEESILMNALNDARTNHVENYSAGINYQLVDFTDIYVDPNTGAVSEKPSTTDRELMPSWLIVSGQSTEFLQGYYSDMFRGEEVTFESTPWSFSDHVNQGMAEFADYVYRIVLEEESSSKTIAVSYDSILDEFDDVEFMVTLVKAADKEDTYMYRAQLKYRPFSTYQFEPAPDELFEKRQEILDAFKSLWPVDEVNEFTNDNLSASFEDVLKCPKEHELLPLSDANNYRLAITTKGGYVGYLFYAEVSPTGELQILE